MAETDKKKTRPIIIGISFIAAIVILIWGYNFLRSKNLFHKETVYYASYQKINGLIKANPVVINGLRVGQVKNVYFNPDLSGDIIVSMMLSTDFPIPNNSVARIFSSDLMGSKAIELVLGNSTIILNEGDTLQTSVEDGLMAEVNAQMQPIKKKAEDLLGSIDTLVIAFQSIFNEQARTNIKESFQNIELTFANLQRTSSNIDTLVVEESSRISDILINMDSLTTALNANKGNIQNIITNFEIISDSLANSEIPGTFARINLALDEMSSILAKIDSGEGTFGKLMNDDSLYLELNRSASALDSLLLDVRKNPKRYVRFSLF
ncbi:MAG: MlaD family protein [Bacteroidales bacterium]|jgi:phospholipid/cholesterol/gamma-HCH transport system substrate-binding protein|nr:mammalian cell entry protein [Lentimicrobiaceae bacterium]MDG1136150.1 MlaD family protein [Bacteroidales bacterium]MDG1902201.1 MlaD family protein [Bacteroidales bacterium]MDG2080163.1 MlaD family protein [Bacteroidales bacterium]|tara:strand:- start:163 stop:1125 length:963 start_codon:yes stop_codon:yes gene_type:complete